MDLFDLIIGLLQLVFALTVKFWPVIIAVLAYKIFGLGRSKQGKSPTRRRDVLTPVQGGGFPERRSAQPVQGESMKQEALKSAKERPAEFNEEPRDWQPSSSEWPKWEPTAQDVTEPAWTVAERSATIPNEQVESEPTPLVTFPHVPSKANETDVKIDPREGMKWALIFSPPRGKVSHRPPYLSPRNDS